MRSHVLAVLVVLLFGGYAAAQSKVGLVVSINGTARLRDGSGSDRRLDSRNYAVSLSAGNSLKADGSGEVQIKLCNGHTEKVRNRWFQITKVVCSIPADPAKQAVLQEVFNFGGRYRANRGDDDFILFPIETGGSVIRPETVAFRWMPVNGKLNLSVAMVGDEHPMWSHEVDGAAGGFTSDELRAALAAATSRPGSKFQLKMTVASLGTENTADFQLLPAGQEALLKKELDETGGDSTVYEHLARAQVYGWHELFLEVATELEEALKLSPDSRDLLNAAATAQANAGNFPRRDELQARVKALKP
ncbi:MAG: hypothetical protein ABIP75_08635 [Pyrinomonadaceae bacterium]